MPGPAEPTENGEGKSVRMDMKAVWKKHSMKEILTMWQDLKAFGRQDNGFSDMGAGGFAKQNMIYRLRHGRYPIEF